MLRFSLRLFSQSKGLPSEISHCLQPFSDALEFVSTNSLPEAESKMSECIEILNSKNLQGSEGHTHILKRLAVLQRDQNKDKNCVESLEQVVESYQDSHADYIPSTLNLIKQCMRTDLEKALNYSHKIKNKPLGNYASEFKFVYGVFFI